MKKFWIVVVLASSIFLLTACGGKKDDSNTISFSWWGTSDRNVATYQAIELFEKKYPQYKVEGEEAPWSGYQQTLSNRLSRNREADVFQINYNWVYSMYGINQFLDINELGLDLSKYPEDEHTPITVDSKTLALSVSETGYVFYLNKDLYDKAGATIPKTWDQLIEAGKKIGAYNSNKYALGRLDAQQVAMLMFSYLSQVTGKNVINEANQLAFSEQELQMGFGFLNELRNNNVLIQSNATDTHNDGPSNPNWQLYENYGGIMTWNTSISEYENTLPGGSEKIVMAGMFQQNEGEQKGMYKKISMAYAVSPRVAATKEKTAAVKAFLEFMTTDPEAVRILGVDRGVSNNTETQQILLDTETTDFTKSLEWQGHNVVQNIFTDQIAKGVDLYIHPYYEHDTFRLIYEAPIERFLFGNATAQQAITDINRRFNTELSNVMNN
ncbi:MAG: ABC transporter substrate-binding protein [Paracholeplasma sp.]|uniref:ABC-type sugar transport system, periplasmic component n=1 Tax=Acholeplasma brassicae TaxID=61635 RepID=U4KR00_9MOLU|nr:MULTISPECIES: ABC transporter substrate-binding protein [Paracholeplasma]MDY3196404.1 ABC transporter substrate-binding protein [Paracholeplasma sp.]CCV65303.1 ABC-type sugar transport system, periplasmic component [Paracholeplasma brassicae]